MRHDLAQPPEVKHKTSRQEILRKKKRCLAFFLTGHPMDEYKQILQTIILYSPQTS